MHGGNAHLQVRSKLLSAQPLRFGSRGVLQDRARDRRLSPSGFDSQLAHQLVSPSVSVCTFSGECWRGHVRPRRDRPAAGRGNLRVAGFGGHAAPPQAGARSMGRGLRPAAIV